MNDKLWMCPFRGGDGKCKRDECALWQQIKRDDGSVKAEGCCLLILSQAITNIATNGLEVYPQ